MHYSDKINSLMIDSIANQENEINANNLNDYLEKSESIVENFDIEKVKKNFHHVRISSSVLIVIRFL